MEPHTIKTMYSIEEPISEAELQSLYGWVDDIPLSRPKKYFARDFSDAGMVAEIVAFYFPQIVEVHNYPTAGSIKLKMENWETLNRKVLRKLQFEVSKEVAEDIAACKPYVIERVLMELRKRIDGVLWQKHQQNTQNDGPESDQYKPKPLKIRKAPPPRVSQRDDSRNRVEARGAGVNVAVGKKPAGAMPEPKVVPVWKYNGLEHESRAKDETIVILQSKVGKMEQLLQLKDLRINELSEEINDLRNANAITTKRRANNAAKATKLNQRKLR